MLFFFVACLYALSRIGREDFLAGRKPEETPLSKAALAGILDASGLRDAPAEMSIALGDQIASVEFTLDPGFQLYLSRLLSRYRVDWGAAAAVDPSTGRVLALASYSHKDPGEENLALRSTFPAASVFKVVTAASALEEGFFRRDSSVRFSGDMYGISPRQVLRDAGSNRMTLANAFAKSANAVFGRIAVNGVGAQYLDSYASRLGFNEPIPLEVAVPVSRAEIPSDDPIATARTAAGFGRVGLSPLHGAVLAGAIAEGGRMMEPSIVSRVVDDEGRLLYRGEPRLWREALSSLTARELRSMMVRTVSEGTARNAFRRVSANPALRGLEIGGKTGSLTGRDPPGRTEWFVGYARGEGDTVALGIVIVSEQFWRIKPADVARHAFEYWFSRGLRAATERG